MRRGFAIVTVAIVLGAVGFTASAQAQTQAQTDGIECDAFVKNADGSWQATRNVAFPGPGRSINIREGSILRPGATIVGTDVAETLNGSCKAEAAAAPAPNAPPQVDIAKLADTNGNIDVQKLTCAQLTSTYQEDAELLMIWYSGWLNGLAKKNAINLPTLREGIHAVIVFCKANKDKRVSQAIESIVKADRR